MERFARVIGSALDPVLHEWGQPASGELELPPDPQLGDFGFPCFRMAKALRQSPPQIAATLCEKLKSHPDLLTHGIETSATGPYLNFKVQPERLFNTLLPEILTGDGWGTYGQSSPGTRGSWVLEFSSPNVAKPLNIYHLRPTALGAALDRIGRYRGYRVTSINHLGDWGKQYGMLTVAFEHFRRPVAPDVTMKELVDLYVRINAEAEKDPTIEVRAREAFLALERGDPAVTAIWKLCVDISLKEFERNYRRLGVTFDHIWGESYYKDLLHPLLESLRKSGTLIESEGAWVVPATDEKGKELPPCLLQKSDGATIYATRDIAAAIYREQQFHFDRMTYIVGGEQRLHFQQIFSVLRTMKQPWADRCEHVPTGLYRFKDAKMSTRKGNFVTLEEVLDLARDRALELMKAREDSSGLDFDETAEAVAIGAVVFHDLHTDPARDVDFDVERVVHFEGETGPYLQYAHTRCLSILRKAAALPAGPLVANWDGKTGLEVLSKLGQPQEISLVKFLGRFPLHLERTLQYSKASMLAHYLIELTQQFGSFYRECQVLGDDRVQSQARLYLVEATRRVLGQGLTLLGIPLPDRM